MKKNDEFYDKTEAPEDIQDNTQGNANGELSDAEADGIASGYYGSLAPIRYELKKYVYKCTNTSCRFFNKEFENSSGSLKRCGACLTNSLKFVRSYKIG